MIRALSRIPVFIITCVVARFTFFLKPRTYDQLTIPLQYDPRFVLPAHDMMADCLLLE